MTKEEIRAQIDVLISLHHSDKDASIYDSLVVMVDKLKLMLRAAKSIQDLQKEAFEAGRRVIDLDSVTWRYETFEEYLESLKAKLKLVKDG